MSQAKDQIDNADEIENRIEESQAEKEQAELEEKRSKTKYGGKLND